jgi:hypothetical protein
MFFVAFCVMIHSSGAAAQEKVSVKGVVAVVNLASQTVLVTTLENEDLLVTVEDEVTLGKLRAGRISPGDQVSIKYVVRDGKNLAIYFRKAAGC